MWELKELRELRELRELKTLVLLLRSALHKGMIRELNYRL